MIGNEEENNPTWRAMMAKPEVSREGMKKVDPHGAKPNRTVGSCTKFR